MVLCPPCFTFIYHDARERALRERIEEIKNETKSILGNSTLDTLLTSIAKGWRLENIMIAPTSEIRNRRGIFETMMSETVNQAIGLFTGNIVSNLISVAFERIYPGSNTNRLGRLETALEDVKRNFEIGRQVDRGVLENLDKLSNVVQEALKRLNEHVQRFPQYTWLSSLIVNKMTHKENPSTHDAVFSQ